MPASASASIARARNDRGQPPPVGAVVAELLAQHRGGGPQPGQPRPGRQVGQEADLADRFESVDVHQVVEDVDRVLRPGQADTAAKAAGELRDVHRLAAGDATRVDVEEADEPHVLVPGPVDERAHGGRVDRRAGTAWSGAGHGITSPPLGPIVAPTK